MNATSFNIVEFNFVGWCCTAWPNVCGADRVVEIKDLGRIIILNFRPNYPLPLPKRLATKVTCNACANAKMLNDVESNV